ncbi:MAG: hypothetical protein Q9159_002763 [Coniocarpon cinnabarinum]
MDIMNSPVYGGRGSDVTSDGFPNFIDGDVQLVIAPGQSYQLHARTLKMYSSRFDSILNPEDATKLEASVRRKGVTTVFRVEFVSPSECRKKGWPATLWHQEAGGLKLRRLDQRGRPTGHSATNLDRALDAGLATNKLFGHWDNVLRAMHQTPMNFDTPGTDYSDEPIDLASLVNDITGICAVADYLSCMRVVTHQIDNALIKQGQILWVAIAAAPWRWADLGMRVHSELIFREAMCHLVGRWPRLTYQASKVDELYPFGGHDALNSDLRYTTEHNLPDPRELLAIIDDEKEQAELEVSQESARKAYDIISELSPEVRTLIQRKVAELDHLKRATNMRLMGYYPSFFARSGTNTTSGPKIQTIGDTITTLGQRFQNVHGYTLPGLASGAAAAGSVTLPNLGFGPASHSNRNSGANFRTQDYAKGILGWMAITLFRHWFGQYVIRINAGYPQLDGGHDIYISIAKGGEHYLGHPGVEGFCSWFPLSAKSRREFDNVIGKIKDELKGYVEDVNKNRLTLDLEKAAGFVARDAGGVEGVFGKDAGIGVRKGKLELKYLVCSEVTGLELPWRLAELKRDKGLTPRGKGVPPGFSGRVATPNTMGSTSSARRRTTTEADVLAMNDDTPVAMSRKSSAKRARFADQEPISRFSPHRTHELDKEGPPRKRRNAFGSAEDAAAPTPVLNPEDDDEIEAFDDVDAEQALRSSSSPLFEREAAVKDASVEASSSAWGKGLNEKQSTPEDGHEKSAQGGNSLFLSPG